MSRKATRIQKEGGVTRISLRNGEILHGRHGSPVWVRLYLHPEHWYVTQAGYADGSTFTFTGFSWGYGGEGPRGLWEWAEKNGVPIPREAVFNPGVLDSDTGVREAKVVWEWFGDGQTFDRV